MRKRCFAKLSHEATFKRFKNLSRAYNSHVPRTSSASTAKETMNEAPREHKTLTFKESPLILNSCLSFVDSNKDFAIDDFRNRITDNQNRFPDDDDDHHHDHDESKLEFHGIRTHHRCLLEREDSAWREAAAVARELDGSRPDLERAFDSVCQSECVIESFGESREEQRKKLTEHDQSLHNLVLYYG